MSCDDSICDTEWSVVEPSESEWSVLSDDTHQYDDGNESEWSIPTSNNVGDEIPSHHRGATSIHFSKRAPVSTASVLQPLKEAHDEDDDDDEDADISDIFKRKARVGKKALKHSLVKRISRDHGRVGCGVAAYDDYIEVVRRGKGEHGSSFKTPIDDLLPELLTCSGGVLGHAQRWADAKQLLECLENEGTAVRIATRSYHNGRYSGLPQDSVHFVVKANGSFNTRVQNKAKASIWNSYTSVLRWQCGRWSVWYELTSEPPLEIKHSPLRAVLRAPPGNGRLDGSARRAFSPGVAGACGAASTLSSLPATEKAVVNREVDLIFGHPVAVTHASIAGKIHATKFETMDAEEDKDCIGWYQQGRWHQHRESKGFHVALDGTEAYCTRVEISARLTANPKIWVTLGTFDGCRDGHTEKAIFLGDCHAASGNNSEVHCIALRFRAVSWHKQPLLRVGAYGHNVDDQQRKDTRKKSILSDNDGCAGFEDGVEYIVYSSEHRDDGTDAVRRRYAIKEGKYFKYHDPRQSQERKRSHIRADIKDGFC